MSEYTKPYEDKMTSAVRHLEKELAAVRAGRANPAILDKVAVDYYELMPENRQFLSTMDNVRPMGEDFYEEQSNVQYDRIIANPPFSGNQDIRHVKRMYACLKPGGIVAAITSIHWQMGQEKVCADFRKWLQEVGAHTYEIGEGKFKESGTGVNTIAIVIAKEAFSV